VIEIIATNDIGNWVEVTRFTDDIWLLPDYTDSFLIDHDEWRIRWEVISIFYIGDLSFWVVPQGNYHVSSFRTNMSIAGVNGPITTNGTLNMDGDTGTFYLFIDTSASKYTLIVEQNIDSIPEFPSWIILPLFLVASLVLIVIKKRLTKTS